MNTIKKMSNKDLIEIIFLVTSSILVLLASFIYLSTHTEFFQEINNLVAQRMQDINIELIILWLLGFIFFIFALFISKNKESLLRSIFLFLFESLLIIATTLFLIGFVVDSFYESFRLALVISGFVIYYAIYKFKQILRF